MSDAAPISAEQMQLVLATSRTLTVTVDLDLLLRRIAEAATKLLACERASIYLHDPATNELWTKVALQSNEIRLPTNAGIAGHVFTANEILHVPRAYDDPRFNPAFDQRSGYTTRNLLTAPMIDIDSKPVGVLQAINKSAGDFGLQDAELIQLLADHAGVAIQRHRLQVAAEQSVALRREMDLARRVQEQLIPKRAPDVPGIEAVGWARMASITGGDVYDLWRRRDGRLAIFLGDASGHGMAPALVVSQARTLARVLSETDMDPHDLLGRINARLAEDLEVGRFVTAFVGYLDSDGRLEWSSAGHGPILARRRGAEWQDLPACGMPLGVSRDWEDERPEPVRLESGGSLVVMSDGIIEAHDPAGVLFGTQRMREVLCREPDATPQRWIDLLREAVRIWQRREDPMDDQTIVIARRT